MPSQNHIVPALIGDPVPRNYPTALRGTERLRLTPTPLHSDTNGRLWYALIPFVDPRTSGEKLTGLVTTEIAWLPDKPMQAPAALRPPLTLKVGQCPPGAVLQPLGARRTIAKPMIALSPSASISSLGSSASMAI